jgi:hypothetical protein
MKNMEFSTSKKEIASLSEASVVFTVLYGTISWKLYNELIREFLLYEHLY